MALITQQQLNDASTDALSLSAFVNNASGTITTRLGRVVKCLAQLVADTAAAGTIVCAGFVRGSDGARLNYKGGTIPTVTRTGTGSYQIAVTGLTSTGIALVTTVGACINSVSCGSGTLTVNIRNVSLALIDSDFSFEVVAL